MSVDIWGFGGCVDIMCVDMGVLVVALMSCVYICGVLVVALMSCVYICGVLVVALMSCV